MDRYSALPTVAAQAPDYTEHINAYEAGYREGFAEGFHFQKLKRPQPGN